ncbi:hypothetical protein [Eubacterium sp. An3]|uniref:hypothetical protein n=1 Tax=Eubacterium sp. An3 TaxID=1965628 RepID=UPI000B36FA37|nr:hypothetical protein [Eubacterium sp. An3]OUO29724.1 hypothetical protein B5F87_04270 [Eubacterium sp. An3]
MKKYRVEFGFGENFSSVTEWQTLDDLAEVDAETTEDAAKDAACTDGLENALFRVYELILNESDDLEKYGEPEYFEF